MNLVNGQTAEAEIRFDENEEINRTMDPVLFHNVNDQAHWIAYLSGQIPERIDTAWLALQTMLVKRRHLPFRPAGQEVAVDEIEAMSESNAIRVQETPYGTFKFDF